jgi:hypothetical protein
VSLNICGDGGDGGDGLRVLMMMMIFDGFFRMASIYYEEYLMRKKEFL